MAPRLILAAVASVALAGCVPQEKYNALKIEKDAISEQLGQAQVDAASAKNAMEAYRAQLEMLNTRGGDLVGLNATLNKQVGELQGQLAAMEAKYLAALEKRDVVMNVLPQPLQNELEQFARDNPEIIEFDAARGIVKFKSDVTFAVGSADLTPQAKQALARCAQILNGAAARNYEFLVAGHTDANPVRNPATIKAGHLNNWYLSAHRSISVGEALSQQGVAQKRLGVVGYADQRPIASNATPSGQARNRRVEIAILPTSVRDGAGPVAGELPAIAPKTGTTGTTVRRPALDLNKDAVIDTRPLINK